MTFDEQPPDDPVADRLAVLRPMTAEQIGQVLAAQPELAASLAGQGLLLSSIPRPPKDGRFTIEHLAALLAHPSAVRIAVQGCGLAAVRLLMVCHTHDGQLTEDEVIAQAPTLDQADRERARAELVDRLLIDPSRGYLVPRPGVLRQIPLPGRSMRELAEGNVVTSDLLQSRLTRLGVTDPPTRKLDRLQLLIEILSDRGAIAELLDTMSPAASSLLRRLSPDPLPIDQFGTDYYLLEQLRYQARFDRIPATASRFSPDTVAMHQLEALGLIGVSPEHTCWVWLEVWVALTGRVFPVWPPPARPDVASIATAASQVPAVVGQLHTLIVHVGAEPLAGLKIGGIGVKVTRDLAKRLGQPPRLTEVLVALARRLRLIEERSEIVGRGRTASWSYTYAASPATAPWADRPAIDRWALIVDGWVHGRDIQDHNSVYVALNRRQLVADLLALPDGLGVAERTASDWFRAKHVVAAHIDVEEMMSDVRLLGLVPTTGPIGLTELARALLTDTATAHDLVPDSVEHFVVQPDHSVVAPANLDANVRARLERISEPVSSGSALVYRLDDVRIGQDLAAGETAEAICAFLAAHSTVPVAPAVTQFVRDVERRRGGLTVAATATVITADDTLGLAEAIKVKAARLTLIAPTVAVSDLPPAKVLAALRAKGLAPRSALPLASAKPTLGATDVGSSSICDPRRAEMTAALEAAPLVIHPGSDQLTARLVGR